MELIVLPTSLLAALLIMPLTLPNGLRTLGGHKEGNYPYSSAATIFDLAVVGGDPVTHLMAFMPAGVVPDQK